MMGKFKNRKFWWRAVRWLAVSAAFLLWLGGGRVADAAGGAFSIEANVLPGGDGDTYDIRVTVLNSGADWEGTVRLMIENRYFTPCAYDTELSLPGGSRKQFTVKVPAESLGDKRGAAHVVLIDKSGKQTASRDYERFLEDKADVLHMGILSDDYPSLTYLDMGGQELYYYRDSYPVKLVELERDNLADWLDSLDFLVVDRYSTESLTDEQMQAILEWNEGGGSLILGTGAYAEDTLGGFDSDHTGVQCLAVYPPGEYSPAAGNQGDSDYYLMIVQKFGLDINKLTVAALQTVQPDCQLLYSGGYVRQTGLGAVCVLPFSLSELGSLGADDFNDQNRADYISYMLSEMGNYSPMSYVVGKDDYDLRYQRNRLFGILDRSGTDLNFGMLKGVVILYVILVGPVLYLILKLMKKRELYWVAVPVLALLGIAVVYMAGRGFEVKDTRVYSVTVENLAGAGEKQTYLMCYDVGHSEWGLKLSEDYAYAGPLESSYNSYSRDIREYYHHIVNSGNDICFGANVTVPFENCSFYAAGAADVSNAAGDKSGVNLQNIEVQIGPKVIGTVVNGTGKDFRCFALVADGVLCVYGGLPAGASVELADMEPITTLSIDYYDRFDIFTSTLIRFYRSDRYEGEIGALAALGIGLCGAADEVLDADCFFMGVEENYELAVDDVCSETSYGCLYTVR